MFSDPYTRPAPLLEGEVPRPGSSEEPMQPDAIRVMRSDQNDAAMGSATRLNLGKEFSPAEYDRLRVKDYGTVHVDSMAALRRQWLAVRNAGSDID